MDLIIELCRFVCCVSVVPRPVPGFTGKFFVHKRVSKILLVLCLKLDWNPTMTRSLRELKIQNTRQPLALEPFALNTQAPQI